MKVSRAEKKLEIKYKSPRCGKICKNILRCLFFVYVKHFLISVASPTAWANKGYILMLNGSNIAQVQLNGGIWSVPVMNGEGMK